MKRTSLFAVSLLSLLVSQSCLAGLLINSEIYVKASDNINTSEPVVLAHETLVSGDAFLIGDQELLLDGNDEGISHIYYDKFNINKSGFTINNEQAQAKLIINEVVSNQKSRLNGRLSVIGEKAAIIIANPNGIDCNDCSFSGTDNVKLITGKSNFQYSDTFNVTDGAITFAFNNTNISNHNPIIAVDQENKELNSINIISNYIDIKKGYLKNTNIELNIGLNEISLNYMNMKVREGGYINRDKLLNIYHNSGIISKSLIIKSGYKFIHKQETPDEYKLALWPDSFKDGNKIAIFNTQKKVKNPGSIVNNINNSISVMRTMNPATSFWERVLSVSIQVQ